MIAIESNISETCLRTCDVLIIGGGPAGSTAASLLLRYAPHLRVMVIERETFPRDHVGESQLPSITPILDEMGVWEKVEEANFPIKTGSTYRWGTTDDLWNLNFLTEPLKEHVRPARLEGQRTQVAFQVDRSIYDKILLEHAESMGAEVLMNAKVTHVEREGDRIERVKAVSNSGDPEDSFEVVAKYYLDASGGSGIIRRTMGVEVDSPTKLKNIAIWDYWQDAEWAETVGTGGTRVQILSLGWGWLWFIAIGLTRTSVGLVTHSHYFKERGQSPEEIYQDAVQQEPRLARLLKSATRENKLQTTRDWSYIADRIVGDNWFLIGDSCGFADPILSAGMTLAHVSARKAAFTVIALERGGDPGWLKAQFNDTHRENIKQHILFADYWYSANGIFTDLKDYCSEIAKAAGLSLDSEGAFRWMSLGGFTSGNTPDVRATGFGLTGWTGISDRISNRKSKWCISGGNVYELQLDDAVEDSIALYSGGEVIKTRCLRKGDKKLPLTGANEIVFEILQRDTDAACVHERLVNYFVRSGVSFGAAKRRVFLFLEVIEAMVLDGWVKVGTDPSRQMMSYDLPSITSFRDAGDVEKPVAEAVI